MDCDKPSQHQTPMASWLPPVLPDLLDLFAQRFELGVGPLFLLQQRRGGFRAEPPKNTRINWLTAFFCAAVREVTGE